ncbi:MULTISPECIES: hypothetical protein [unclassified Sutcliffiella]|uniref:hypothetical protein n=2 Tax=unclassified Sutcliffiella TaxID=2837532 RepID=UPI0030D3C182
MEQSKRFNRKVVPLLPRNDIINNKKYTPYNIPLTSFQEVASGKDSFQEGEEMKNEQEYTGILFEELKRDIREREERSRREISEREERFLKQMEQFSKDAKEREDRYREEAKERELRISQSIETLQTEFKETKKDLVDTSRYIKTLSITSIIALVTTGVAIAGVAITIFMTIK